MKPQSIHRLLMLAASVLSSAIATEPVHAADDPSCKTVFDAFMKQNETPFHETITTNGRPFEKIATTTAIYTGHGGHWTSIPATPQDRIEITRETGASMSNCKPLRQETVDGQSATVYAAHMQTKSPPSITDSQIWIGASSGLPLQSESDAVGGGRKMHLSNHFTYANVQAPAGVK
jgi:hypothetical protein